MYFKGTSEARRRRELSGRASTREPRPLKYIKNMLCPREESNLDQLVRSEPFYPLNYGGVD